MAPLPRASVLTYLVLAASLCLASADIIPPTMKWAKHLLKIQNLSEATNHVLLGALPNTR